MIVTKCLITIATITLLATAANAAESVSVKVLLMQALNAPNGAAKGVVEGKEADAIHAATGASVPIRAEVSTIKKFNQEGCSRLAVKLIQPNTPTKEGGKTDFALNYELNLCRNGTPPNEGMDLGKAAKILGN
ncbi:conserved exported hypothetical protein [Candidatus Nitrotoga sp. HW29]|uniref:hypothetical protein n=1 Tax=Candidatus Nitrotoga sp. HW29 TaxID=2886963 RepID=UPI000E3966D0|nr:hypothetical protein [Candidatus Nitrotoga sp. HW29]RFC31740.1 MAG: hypothetical protein DID92_2727745751 [Candidatus Nitrotoga sp. SPKER]CAH1905046.1 conserved exported hypothetical protein [Candidatus Nitrotoga sp. HW29]